MTVYCYLTNRFCTLNQLNNYSITVMLNFQFEILSFKFLLIFELCYLPFTHECIRKYNFIIFISDISPPRIDECVSPAPIVSYSQAVEVNLKPPIFSDNSGNPVEVVSSHGNGKIFSMGITRIRYTATDSSNNNNTCDISVTIIRKLWQT